jgi:transposase-like protein/DDE family transposase
MQNVTESQLPNLSTEFASVDLGDGRSHRRLWQILEQLTANPDAGFPDAMADEAALEGLYRFINNPRVTHDRILEPHQEETRVRCEAEQRVLVPHDTTEVGYEGESRRRGLGRMSGAGQGYFAHVSLAVSADGLRRPLGLLGLKTYTRSLQRQDAETKQKRKRCAQPDTESQRWIEQVKLVEEQARGRFRAIHVMDREADASALLAELTDIKADFVIRCYRDRELIPKEDQPAQRLQDALTKALPVVTREVPISRRNAKRPPDACKKHPPREARVARLAISACSVMVKPTAFSGTKAPIRLHCVHVLEVDPPAGEEPVQWRLWTVLPIETPEQILAIVDFYRARWLIEEFFKSLKTGCRLEQRQSESLHALLNVLALLIPVAWRLLLLRHLARHEPHAPASAALTPAQQAVLKAMRGERWPSKPTVRDALLAIAALGGHIRANGDPGWLVLGRGMEKLLLLEIGWCARGE